MLCEIPAAGNNVTRVVLPAHLLHFLQRFEGTQGVEQVLNATQDMDGDTPLRDYSRSKLLSLIEDFCVPKGLLLDSERPFAQPQGAPSNKNLYLYFKLKLLSHPTVYAPAKRMAFLFSKPVFLMFLSLSAIMHVAFYLYLSEHLQLNINRLNAQQVVGICVITLLGALAHEFGHATALARHGCKNLAIGLGLYIYLPVLYTDVSEAWNLKPRERAMVDIGGIYFHNIFEIALVLLFYWTGNLLFLYAIFPIDVTIACSLNPFLRMDGYWLVADLFGIWNPRKQSVAVMKRLGRRLWPTTASKRSQPTVIKPITRSTVALFAYTALSMVFFAWLSVLMARQIIFFVIPHYPDAWLLLFNELRHGSASSTFSIFRAAEDICWKTVFLGGCALLLWRTSCAVVQRAVAWSRRSSGFGDATDSLIGRLPKAGWLIVGEEDSSILTRQTPDNPNSKT